MADDKQEYDDNTEYQFTDDASDQSYEQVDDSDTSSVEDDQATEVDGERDYQYEDTGATQTASAPGHNKKRLAIVIAVIAVILIVLYVIFSSLFSSKYTTSKSHSPMSLQSADFKSQKNANLADSTALKKTPLTGKTDKSNLSMLQALHANSSDKKQAKKASQAIPAPQPQNANLIKQDISSVVASQKQGESVLNERLNQLANKSDHMLSSIENQEFQSKSDIMNLQSSLSKLDNQVSTQNLLLNRLAGFQEQQAKQVRMKEIARQHAVITARRSKGYHVDAVIQGRAWLRGLDGTTLSVSVGQVVPNYGTVLNINPISGTVTTTCCTLRYAN
jgi:hypothetical protein